jgi:hypothetical protein
MARNIGIQLNGDYDLDIKVKRDSNGLITQGIVIGDTTYQNQALILECHPGEIKEYPTLGVGLNDVVNDHDFEMWKRSITENLEADGMQISKLDIDNTGLTLEAKYK